jgi:hypothetical protein
MGFFFELKRLNEQHALAEMKLASMREEKARKEEEYRKTHYPVQVKCSNCKNQTSIDWIKGKRATKASMKDVICEKCGVKGTIGPLTDAELKKVEEAKEAERQRARQETERSNAENSRIFAENQRIIDADDNQRQRDLNWQYWMDDKIK